jgi:hypothetical protein
LPDGLHLPPPNFLADSQYKSITGGVTGVLQPISKQDLETAFFSDDKKVKDKSVE